MSLVLSVTSRTIEVPFTIGTNLIPQGLKLSQEIGRQCIITTETLSPLLPILKDPILVPSHEAIKNRAMKEWIEEILYERGVNRDVVLIAIGGGTLLDLVGFVASTFMRGVALILFPTTLLAMTDAAIGGKNGVNLKEGKNWIGTYYHPRHVYIDLNFLQTLPQDIWIQGLSETIKHALIADQEFFYFLKENLPLILQRDLSVVEKMIKKSVSIKCAIVEQDPFEENGLRFVLNFGHTVAHALEVQSKYLLPHGEAVAMGMIVEAAMSLRLGLLNQEVYEKIITLVKAIPFELTFPKYLSYELILRDKKNGLFVALSDIGKPVLKGIDSTLFKQGWNDALRDSQRELLSCSYGCK